ncbi:MULTISPECIES: hypothetical protein [Virgibacillus]|uniref:hypothetical protein n=1 Tax=Virgibacillus TaxID=84406 RepID=UPI0012EB8343|nr:MULTISPECIES: hypothetical protein [Virgibacillus]MBS7428138.1 hypothetical protein [Virgibacillus sp. 19R1-5]QTY16879.1 hypothetical protein KBP50_02870 [Virgibacillus pantothenticus]
MHLEYSNYSVRYYLVVAGYTFIREGILVVVTWRVLGHPFTIHPVFVAILSSL